MYPTVVKKIVKKGVSYTLLISLTLLTSCSQMTDLFQSDTVKTVKNTSWTSNESAITLSWSNEALSPSIAYKNIIIKRKKQTETTYTVIYNHTISQQQRSRDTEEYKKTKEY